MKKLILFLPVLLVCQPLSAQVDWSVQASDSAELKINRIENIEDGSLYRVMGRNPSSQLELDLQKLDTSGLVSQQVTLQLPGNNPSLATFNADTVQDRLVLCGQWEDNSQFFLWLMVFDYNLQFQDSALYSLQKSKTDQLTVKGGGKDLLGNSYIIYNYRDANDLLWGRGVCKKETSGTYKTNQFKAGQSPGDGLFINDCFVAPPGIIWVGGARKETATGNFIYLEKINSSLSTGFEIKDQLIPGNTFINQVTSLHVYTNNANSQVVIGGAVYGLAPGDTVFRSHGYIRAYTANGALRWNFQNADVRNYVKVIGKYSYVHAIGTNNKISSGLDTRITRLFLKDGVLNWNRYYGNKSIPIDLCIERDGSLLIVGERERIASLPAGGTIPLRSYMLTRYSKAGKRLYDYLFNWSLQAGFAAGRSAFTDVATGPTGKYFASGWNSLSVSSGSTIQKSDSLVIMRFGNGSLRTGNSISEGELLAYPNPGREDVYIDLPEQLTDIHLLSSHGAEQPLLQWEKNDSKLRIPIQHLQPGMYILEIQTESGNHYLKFIKE
jgi:hypothetical protein